VSYHKLNIHKHAVGSPYKIQEEFLEYIDAIATGNKVMAVQELSDLYGCLENEINKFGMSVGDLKVMSDLTKQVFTNGTRYNEDFLSYLKRESDSILSWGLGFIQVKCEDINYNFYHKGVQKFESSNAPHNHQQDFIGEILKGRIEETLYSTSGGGQRAYVACGNKAEHDLAIGCDISGSVTHKEGDLYLRLNNEYHSVEGEHGTITKVIKYGSKIDAYVISEREEEMIKHVPELICWRMVEETLSVQH
jgi:hypothetical protein